MKFFKIQTYRKTLELLTSLIQRPWAMIN